MRGSEKLVRVMRLTTAGSYYPPTRQREELVLQESRGQGQLLKPGIMTSLWVELELQRRHSCCWSPIPKQRMGVLCLASHTPSSSRLLLCAKPSCEPIDCGAYECSLQVSPPSHSEQNRERMRNASENKQNPLYFGL